MEKKSGGKGRGLDKKRLPQGTRRGTERNPTLPQRATLKFHPVEGSRAKYEKYREAWCLLMCDRNRRGRGDVPKVCRSREVGVRCEVCPEK